MVSQGFFAVGVYTSVVIYKTLKWPLLFTIPLAAVIAGLLGLGMGYLTLRLRGVFFSIATLAMSVVLNTLIVNWSFVGGSRGVYILHPETMPYFGTYARYLFVVMLILAMGSILIARFIENSWIGNGLAALKDDEMAAECAERAVAADEVVCNHGQRCTAWGHWCSVSIFRHLR